MDAEDSSAFLDVRRVIKEKNGAAAGVAAQVETFGLMLLGSLTQERDPALHEAVAARLTGAAMLDDPAALLSGGSEVTDVSGVAVTPTPDTAAASTRAVARLLAARSQCVDASQAVALTSAGLRVISNAAASSD